MKRFYIFQFWFFFAFVCLYTNGCTDSDTMSSAEPLSVDLAKLADKLRHADTCALKKSTLYAWTEDNEQTILAHKKSFDLACRNNNRSDIYCMTFQILASASVEIEIRDCAEDREIMEKLAHLNEIAGTAILKTTK